MKKHIVIVATIFLLISPKFAQSVEKKQECTLINLKDTNKVLQLINAERKKEKLPPLMMNNRLTSASFKKAQDMHDKNYWSHFAPDGTSPWYFIQQAGFNYNYAGENLAKNFICSEDMVQAWMNSPTHRENIMRKEFNEIGITVGSTQEGRPLIVTMFGNEKNIQKRGR